MDEEQTGTPPDEPADELEPEVAGDETVADEAGDEMGETRVLGGEPEQPTQVLPAEEPTRVVGAAPPRPAPPPPPLQQPTITVTRRRSSSSAVWWIVIVLLVLAAALVAVFLVLRADGGGSAGQDFVGTWMPADGSSGGLVIKQNGDAFTVTAYDAQIQKVGSGQATLSDGELTLTLPAAALGATGGDTIQVTISYLSGPDSLHVVAQSAGTTQVTRDYVRTDALQPVQPTPAPAPTPTPTPTITPSPTTSGSPSASADQEVQSGLMKINAGIISWATNSNGVYPAAMEVAATGGIAQYVAPWPVNPYTQQHMGPGTAPGDYEYEQLSGGQGYRLVGHLSNGDVTWQSTP